MDEKTCPTCGNKFVPPTNNKYKTYCSKECYWKRKPYKPAPFTLTPTEKFFKENFKKNVTKILRTGFPDFLVEINNEIIFVEVKNKDDGINQNQVEMMDMLSKHGLSCFISIDGSNDLIPFEDIKPYLDSDITRQTISSIISKMLSS